MPISRSLMKTLMNTIVDSEVLDRVITRLGKKSVKEHPLARNLSKSSQMFEYPHLTGQLDRVDPSTYEKNIENFIGVAQIPVGIAGPLRVNGVHANGDFQVPLATTEAALVASYNRGARLISISGGVTVMCLNDYISRAPGFVFKTLIQSAQFVAWCSEHFETFKQIAGDTSRFARLQDIQPSIEGNYVYINFYYSTGDAAGQNMVTIATDAICQYIKTHCPIQPEYWFIDGNMSGDKKATKLSHLAGRGKKVLAEIEIPPKLVKRILHATPEQIVQYSNMATQGGIQSGSIGTHGHYANALAALYIACGQDAACVAESAVGTSRAELRSNGDLYVSVSLPNLVVGTVGGGTKLPTQNECLKILGCDGTGHSRKFAEICAATVMAGELSIAGAMAAGHFTRAHVQHARGKENNAKKGIFSKGYCSTI